MLTYQVHGRAFRLVRKGDRFSFPNEGEIIFVLLPQAPFGGSLEGSQTLRQDTRGSVLWSGSFGRQWVEPTVSLEPVDVTIQHPDLMVVFAGNKMTMTGRFDDLRDLTQRVEGVYYGLPLLLNLDFIDSPYVLQVTGNLGGCPFEWGLTQGRGAIDITNTEQQEKRIIKAWDRFGLISKNQNRRLLAALNSFFKACRLERAGYSSHEFSSEILLNLAKTLEALFPAKEGKSIEAARAGLRMLGLADAEIEAHFIPSIALRNQIDVGHVFLALLPAGELRVLHDYVEAAEGYFRQLLRRVCVALENGEFDLTPNDDTGPRKEVSKVIERMKAAASEASSDSEG